MRLGSLVNKCTCLVYQNRIRTIHITKCLIGLLICTYYGICTSGSLTHTRLEMEGKIVQKVLQVLLKQRHNGFVFHVWIRHTGITTYRPPYERLVFYLP